MSLTLSHIKQSISSSIYHQGQLDILKRIEQYYTQCIIYYGNNKLYDFVRSFIPLDDINKKSEELLKDSSFIFKTLTEEEHKQESFICSLMDWFKNSFFSWVDAPKCISCSNKTIHNGMGTPTSEDLSGSATRIELYKCETCGCITRFPRYNNPLILLKTRKGRCGEWANTFTLICCSLGLKTRIIFDMTDHLWVEIYISNKNKGKWYHMDPCENIFNAPLVYEKGWGKKLNYIFGFHKSGIADVSLRYTASWNNIKSQRILVQEEWLYGFIYYFNFTILTGGAPYFLTWNINEQKSIFKELIDEYNYLVHKQNTITSSNEYQPRQSGSEEWRTSRGEMGLNKVSVLPLEYKTNSNLRILFSFKKFNNSIKTLQLQGNTKICNSVLQLTENKPSQRSACWFIQPLSILESFITRFHFQILNPGADGFAFVIQGEGRNALGNDGGEKGFGGISKSIAIEFDTYENYSQLNDPNGNHISIQSRGKLSNSAHHRFSLGCSSTLPIQLNDQQKHYVIIAFDCIKGICYVELDNKLVLNIPLKISEILENSCDKLYFGFTAGTGGISQSHLILDWEVLKPI